MAKKNTFKTFLSDIPQNLFSGFVVSLIALPLGLGLALASGAPILCDVEMVARGIIARALPKGTSPIVTLNDARTPELARELGTTRSAAAVDLWRDHIEGAVVAIGNAPTALFHLLERIDAGWPKPAVILGFPVGFVGAAESKAALAESVIPDEDSILSSLNLEELEDLLN